MALYAYADETSFTINRDTNELALGYGILVTDTEIQQQVIDEAMEALRMDEDFDNRKDKRTISNQYFHASEDSKNAHSHFCRSIKENVKGIFDYTFQDHLQQADLNKKGLTEQVFNRCLNQSTLELFQTTDEVFLIIEKREAISYKTLAQWLSNLQKLYAGSTYEETSFKTFYPKVTIRLKDKKDPGLQVIDFLIWAANRTKIKNPNNTWHYRLSYKSWYSYANKGNQNRAKFYLNTAPELINASESYPIVFTAPEEWQQCIDAYIIIEKFLVHLEASDFTDQSRHLYDDFTAVASKVKRMDYYLTNEDLIEIGSIFLRLFDTLPLYKEVDETDTKAWTLLLYAKYIASMLIRREQIHFNRTKDGILRWRYRAQTEFAEDYQQLLYTNE